MCVGEKPLTWFKCDMCVGGPPSQIVKRQYNISYCRQLNIFKNIDTQSDRKMDNTFNKAAYKRQNEKFHQKSQ